MITSTTAAAVSSGTRGGERMGRERVGFDEFVAARSTALLRTAYLLTHDHGLAEDLVQTALTKSWFAWDRISGEPEAYVRKVLVNTFASWWRRKWNGEHPSDDLPDGITEGGVTFRRSMGEQRLIDAAVGAPGEAELTVPATADSRRVAVYYFCSGGTEEVSVDLYVGDDDGPVENYGPCQDVVPVDAAEAHAVSARTSGEDATLRLVVRDANGDVVDDPDVRVGAGLYSEPAYPITIDSAPDFVENSGHRWELFDVSMGDADPTSLFVRAPRDRGVVLAVIRAEMRDATVDLGSDGGVRSTEGVTVTELLAPGGRTGYRVVDGVVSESDRFQIALYQRAD